MFFGAWFGAAVILCMFDEMWGWSCGIVMGLSALECGGVWYDTRREVGLGADGAFVMLLS